MNVPGTTNRGPAQAPVVEKIATATKPHDLDQPSCRDRLPVVRAVLLLAVAGALYDRLLVRTCCWCGYAHLHYLPVGGETSGIVRAPRCRPSRRYSVEVVDVLPVALVGGGLRKRGAA